MFGRQNVIVSECAYYFVFETRYIRRKRRTPLEQTDSVAVHRSYSKRNRNRQRSTFVTRRFGGPGFAVPPRHAFGSCAAGSVYRIISRLRARVRALVERFPDRYHPDRRSSSRRDVRSTTHRYTRCDADVVIDDLPRVCRR